jgi:hypothetical protein
MTWLFVKKFAAEKRSSDRYWIRFHTFQCVSTLTKNRTKDIDLASELSRCAPDSDGAREMEIMAFVRRHFAGMTKCKRRENHQLVKIIRTVSKSQQSHCTALNIPVLRVTIDSPRIFCPNCFIGATGCSFHPSISSATKDAGESIVIY